MKWNAELEKSIQEAVNLGHFKLFCEKNTAGDARQRMRTIYSRTDDPIETTRHVFANEFGVALSGPEAERLFVLITSFLKKSDYRKGIENKRKTDLLKRQGHRCAICGCDIDVHAHADHIVPFKFVGDELDDNLQMLCSDCNLKKNASLDYQIRFLLRTV